METYITVCKIDNQREFGMTQRTQGSAGGRDGESDRREVQEGGDRRIPMAEHTYMETVKRLAGNGP